MSVQRAILPGILIGSFAVVLVVSLISNPTIVLASTPPPANRAQNSPQIFSGDPANQGQAAQNQAVNNGQPVSQADTTNDTCSLPFNFDSSIRQWCSLIERYSTQNNLDPALIAALITQESAGDPQAYSHSGAVGLMQVMPRDGLAANFMCPAGPCFADRPSTQELYDPEFNISYGTRMLANLLNRHGNMRDALKAYGPKDVGYYYADIVLGIFNGAR